MKPVVIDVDSHFQEPPEWLVDADAELARQVSPSWYFHTSTADLFDFFTDNSPRELVNQHSHLLPEPTRAAQKYAASFDSLAEASRALQQSTYRGMVYPWAGYRPEERLKHLDDNGIDIQFINPAGGLASIARLARNLGPHVVSRATRAYNTWAAGILAGHTDRLVPTTVLNWDDPAWSIGELGRMRALGSRAFLIPGRPIGGRSIVHPDFEPVWAAAADLGMVGVLHVGFIGCPVLAEGWYNAGGSGLADVGYILGSISPVVPQMVSAAMIVSGLLERHPNLHILIEEFGAAEWAPAWVDGFDNLLDLHVLRQITGKWTLPLKPSEYFRRQILMAAQPGDDIGPAMELLGPGSVVFSSDFPHPEGSDSATALFADQSNGDADAMAMFFGARMQEVLTAGS
jgi:predicted TIM-barrel fold metal-dependent hydrolase